MNILYQHKDYRDFLLTTFESQGKRTGFKKSAAEFLKIHTSFLSLVLSKKADLSLEQAESMTRFLRLNEFDSHFFILLVSKNKAGTSQLQKHFNMQIEIHLRKRKELEDRIQPSQKVSENDQAKFYSHWIFSAIHVAASIPKFQTRDTLLSLFSIKPTELDEILNFLLKLGVLKKEKERFLPGSNHIHIGKDSPNLTRHHINLRLKSLEKITLSTDDDLRFSSFVSLSIEDCEKIKEILLKSLESSMEIIKDSKEETMYGFNFDFYRIC